MKIDKQNGFTLVEILAAITLLGIITVVFIPFFSQYATMTRIADDKLTAINIADDVSYRLKNNPALVELLQDPTSNYKSSCQQPEELPLRAIGEQADVSINNENYYPAILICQTSDEELWQLYRVQIEIYRDSDTMKPRKLTELFTYISLAGSEENE